MRCHHPRIIGGALICREAPAISIDFDKRVEPLKPQIPGQPVVSVRSRPRRRQDFENNPRVAKAAHARILRHNIGGIAADRRDRQAQVVLADLQGYQLLILKTTFLSLT